MKNNYKTLPTTVNSQNKANSLALIDKLNSFPVLTKEQETSLFIQFRNGNIIARDKLINSQLKLVIKIARSLLKNKRSNLWDLIQEGSVGLVESFKYFNPDKGRFSTIASFHIRNKILRKIMQDASVVSIPESSGKRKAFHKLNIIKSQIGAFDNLNEDHIAKIKSKLQIKEADIIFMNQRMSLGDQSLNEPLNDEDNSERIELLKDNTSEEFNSMEEFLIDKIEGNEINNFNINKLNKLILSKLNTREQKVIKLRRLDIKQKSLAFIGKKIGISAERVRQIENEALKKLEKNLNSNLKIAI